MITLFLAVALPAALPPEAATASCQIVEPRLAHAARDTSPRLKLLGELPPADHVLAVQRTIDGCETPVIVRYGITGR